MDFPDWLFQQTSLSKNTIRNYCYWIGKLGWKKTPKQIEETLLIAKNNYNPNTTKLIFSAFKLYGKFVNKNLVIPRNSKKIEMPKTCLSENQFRNLIDNFVSDNTYISQRNRLIFFTLFKTGLRAAEILNLKKIDLNMGLLKVSGKRGKIRFIPISEGLAKSLESLPTKKYIFETISGQKITYQGLYWILKKARQQLNITEDITLHSFRRGFATSLYKSGVPLNMIARLLGHASINTTELYLKYDVDDIREVLQKIWF